MRSTIIALLLIAAAVTGCSKSTVKPQWEKISELQKKNSLLDQQTKELTEQMEELQKLNKTLASLDKEARSDALNRLDRIEIQNRSGLYDKDDNGTKEKLIVYIKPFDDTPDPFKAAGRVEVELWNLDAEPQQARIGKWTVEPQQLKKLWSATFMTGYFRLTFDLENQIKEPAQNLTIKVKFTDYITGKVLNTQKAIAKTQK
ncbi:MAG: hypothetical protein KAS23_14215 [Anaerohalosphaera sp.]|nr:hypothetical protein [Anaerohalosphaera sp.]